MAWKRRRYSSSSSNATVWIDHLKERVNRLTSRALCQTPCPVNIQQLNAMIVPPNKLALLRAAAECAPAYFNTSSPGTRKEVSIWFTAPGDVKYTMYVVLPSTNYYAEYGSSEYKRMILPDKPDTVYAFHEHADPAHVAAFTSWAVNRHVLGLKAASVKHLVNHLAGKSANGNQLHKAWPLVFDILPGGHSMDGKLARYPQGWDKTVYQTGIDACNGFLAMCALLSDETPKKWLESEIQGKVQWHTKEAKVPWTNEVIKAE